LADPRVQPAVSNSKWIGRAFSLALCIAALPACSKAGNSSNRAEPSPAGSSETEVAWNSKTEQQLREAIAQAPAHGLKPELFLKGNENGTALTQAALRYASALANGYADPVKLHDVYTIDRPKVDVRPGFRQAIQNGDVGEWLNSLAPQTDEYRALSQAHVQYLQLAAKTQFQPVPDGKPIKPGSHDPRVPAVAAALQAVGYLNPPQGQARNGQARAAPAQSAAYAPQLVAAIRKLQGDFGFKPDGVIGGDTLDALNAGPAYRARQTAIAMERLRWEQREPPQTRIDVNTAAAFLDYWRDGQPTDHRNVVAGEPDKPTPQIQAPMFQLVANPVWRIPDSVVKDELAGKSQAYLAKNDMEYQNGRLVQKSGPKNSLGIVKFDMNDKQSIYLHDTPAKALFALPERHRSHGCVRVENALQFAAALADEQGILDDFQRAMAKQDETFVKLKTPIPVRLLYHTAFWDGSQVRFRADVYGWDDNVAKALGLEPGPPQKIITQPKSTDIGP
jgi:murein L,D-transpeptidase YcbB/YkuD